MIPENYTYLTVNFFTIIFPFIFSLTKWFNFSDYWKYYFPGNILVAIVYLIWDSFYTHLGVWGFDFKYTLGVHIFNLPIDEILFFICTPFACVFTYFCFKKYVFDKLNYQSNMLWLFSSVAFFILSIVFYSKLYTGAAFFSCGIACLICYKTKLISFIHFLIFYLVILIPFTICNGVLTGSFLNRVVVFYNDAENLGIRILTIPFEDIFYGMAMLMFNLLLFEYSLSKNKISHV
jgi:lycopene cyclase domain-containing protein